MIDLRKQNYLQSESEQKKKIVKNRIKNSIEYPIITTTTTSHYHHHNRSHQWLSTKLPARQINNIEQINWIEKKPRFFVHIRSAFDSSVFFFFLLDIDWANLIIETKEREKDRGKPKLMACKEGKSWRKNCRTSKI